MGEMTTLSTSLSSMPACVIQIRLLYAYGNANEHWSFFHYANQLLPSLVTINAIASAVHGGAKSSTNLVDRSKLTSTTACQGIASSNTSKHISVHLFIAKCAESNVQRAFKGSQCVVDALVALLRHRLCGTAHLVGHSFCKMTARKRRHHHATPYSLCTQHLSPNPQSHTPSIPWGGLCDVNERAVSDRRTR